MRAWFDYGQTIAGRYPLGMSVLSGLLLGAGLLQAELFLLTMMGIALSVWCASRYNNLRTLILGGFISWCTKFFLSASFFWDTFPVYWLNEVSPVIQFSAIGINWFLTCASLAVGGSLLWVGIHYITRYGIRDWLVIGVIASWWVVCEVISSILYSLVFYGNGGLIGPHFSGGYVGYALAATPLLYFGALIAGVYSLTFLVVVMSQIILYWSNLRWVMVLSICTLIIFVSSVTSYIVTYAPQGITIATIDTLLRDRSGTPESAAIAVAVTHEAVLAGLKERPEYLILPEDARYFSRLNQLAPTPANALSTFVIRSSDTVIIDSGRSMLSSGAVVLRATYYQAGESIATVDKRYLTPQGEFISYWQSWLLRLFGYDAALEYFQASYVPGAPPTITDDSRLPALLFCFEASQPLAVSRRVGKHTPFVVYPISHAWFYDAKTLTHQMDMVMRTHAVWNQIPIVSAANMETGKVYYPDGRIVVHRVVAEGTGWRLRVFEI
jgi:predicted amidohydrolase